MTIRDIIEEVYNGELENMRNETYNVLGEKVLDFLESKKIEMASEFFAQKTPDTK